MTIELKSTESVEFMEYVEAFNYAYQDYFVPLQLDADRMRGMIHRESVDLDASVVAVDGGKIVGSCMLGIREDQGWIGGMGVIPEYRRQGIARQMMDYLVDMGRQLNLKNLILEVISQNVGAVELYEKVGFHKTRDLLILDRPQTDFVTVDGYVVTQTNMDTVLNLFDTFHEETLPWQRDKVSMESMKDYMEARAVSSEAAPDKILAYGAGWLRDERIQMMDVGVDPEVENATEIVKALFTGMFAEKPNASSGLINISEHDVIVPALYDLGYHTSMRQHEMKYDY